MNKVLDLIHKKQLEFEQDLVMHLKELKKMQEEVKANPEKAFEISMKKYPSVQTNLVSKKMCVKLLIELKKEILDMDKIEV
jgi:tRNA A37 threonylcarbamoyladenosine synthetase subunit TsaC/SUA5/YrdC